MSDVMYHVRTVYETDSKGAVGGMGGMASAADRTSGALGSLGKLAAGVLGGMVVAGALAGVGAVALLSHGINGLNGRAEEMQISLAGMAGALNVAGTDGGQTAEGWARAMAGSAEQINQVRQLAAALPGEEAEHLDVLESALSASLESGLAHADVAPFTSRVAAVGLAFHLDAPTIGRELNMLLHGRAGAHNVLWTRLQSTIGKTAEEFNRLSISQRRVLIQGSLDRYGPMLAAYANSWRAVSSTTASYASSVLRLFSSPLFHEVTDELHGMNDWWGRNKKSIDEIVNGAGIALVDTFMRARNRAHELFGELDRWSSSPTGQRLLGLGDRLRAGASSLVDRARAAIEEHPAAAASVGAAGLGLAAGIPGLGLAAGALFAFAQHTEAANATMSNLSSAGGSMLGVVGGLVPLLLGVDNVMGGFLAGALPAASAGVASLAGAVDGAVEKLGPAFGGLLGALAPVLEVFGVAVGSIAQMLMVTLGGALDSVATALSAFANFVHGMVSSLGGWLAQHGITVASTTNAVREGMAMQYAALTTPFRFAAGLVGNAARNLSHGAVNMGAVGGGGASHTGAVNYVNDGSLFGSFMRGYQAMGGRALNGRSITPIGAPAPHVQTASERWAATMSSFHESIEALRRPLATPPRAGLGGAPPPGGERAAGHPGHPVVNVHIHQTVNANEDPDRIMFLTRRGVHLGIYAPLESPGVRVTH